VHEGQVREVAEIVDDQQPVGIVVQIRRQPAPFRIVQRRIIDDQRRIRECRIAHPDPQEMASLHHRITVHPQGLRYAILPRHLDAGAGGVVLHAVIHAAQTVPFDAPHRKGRAAMAAAIIERDVLAAFAAEQDHGFFQYGSRQFPAVDQLVIPGRHVPAILEKDMLFVIHDSHHRLPKTRRYFPYHRPF
jgi:hypothetical protein